MFTETTELSQLFGKPTSVTPSKGGLASCLRDDECVVVGAYIPTNVDDMESEMFTHKQRKQNICDICGKPGAIYGDECDGSGKRRTLLCKDINCDNYVNVYLNKLLSPIKRLIASGTRVFFYHFSPEQDVTNLLRAAGKENYKRLPQTDGSTYLLSNDTVTFTAMSNALLGDITELDQLDWINIVRSKKGNISGNLGKEANNEKENPDAVKFTYIRYTTLVFRRNSEGEAYIPSNLEFMQVEAEVVMETLDLEPTTLEELAVALQTRAEVRAKKWQNRGYQVQVVPQKVTKKLCLYDIQWGKYNRHIEQIQQAFIELPELLHCDA